MSGSIVRSRVLLPLHYAFACTTAAVLTSRSYCCTHTEFAVTTTSRLLVYAANTAAVLTLCMLLPGPTRTPP
eukprot:3114873-Rhodomonas_salina.1